MNYFKNSNLVDFLEEADSEKALKEVKVYDKIGSKKVVATIPKGTPVKMLTSYYSESWECPAAEDMFVYVEYNGVKGWVEYNSANFKSAKEVEDWCSGEDD